MPLERPQSRKPRSARLSLFGDGLPERLRSTSFALLGVAVAGGLVLVGLVFHQSWPVAPDLPIPGFSPRHEAVHEGTVVAEADPAGASRKGRAVDGGNRPSAPRATSTPRAHSRLAGADRVAASPVRDPEPSQREPAPTAGDPPSVESPHSQSASPAPSEAAPSAPDPAPVESTPPAASSVDEPVDDASDEEDEDEEREKGSQHRGDTDVPGRGRARSRGKHRSPPPVEVGREGAPGAPVPTPEIEGDDESEQDELDDEDEADQPGDRGRGRGPWRRR